VILEMPHNLAAVLLSYLQHAIWLVSLVAAWLIGKHWSSWFVAAMVALAASWMTRGWIGELSGLHTLWSASVLLAAWRLRERVQMPRSVAAAIVLLGFVLYPSALHLVSFDVYALGYFSPLSAGFVALAALSACGIRRTCGTCCSMCLCGSARFGRWFLPSDAPSHECISRAKQTSQAAHPAPSGAWRAAAG
jgi:hypothetical protein